MGFCFGVLCCLRPLDQFPRDRVWAYSVVLGFLSISHWMMCRPTLLSYAHWFFSMGCCFDLHYCPRPFKPFPWDYVLALSVVLGFLILFLGMLYWLTLWSKAFSSIPNRCCKGLLCFLRSIDRFKWDAVEEYFFFLGPLILFHGVLYCPTMMS